MSVSGTMIMLPKNGFPPPIRRRRRVKYGLTPPLQHFRRRPRLVTTVRMKVKEFQNSCLKLKPLTTKSETFGSGSSLTGVVDVSVEINLVNN